MKQTRLWLTIEDCTLTDGQHSIELNAKELMIIIKLFINKETKPFVSPLTLNEEVWKESHFQRGRDSQKIRYYLFRMKKKMEEGLNIKDFFYSVHGKGYKMNDAIDLKIRIVKD